ncbi:MAG: Peptidase M16 domain protein [Candidatus Uhrbacteria bacterium GW2011_GWA2_52_8d]|uniref:Peptidase M16 domain protein n=1 Tax=Candidatus Uhrbacteria bacterium GW2011_GWA2_52_8d TaxID=1618979 RepID=A0A0G1XK42_9BACT|nr:MAG: Peptidase M16 domain protein [Candidatus Uhrbacteria bacterium GW2011_GWA2_52_8d]
MTQLTLQNGLRVLLAPVNGTDTVSVLVLVRVGSRYEPAHLNGSCHFIEHMMFKGTRRRPTAQHISRTLDAIGADFNAFTGKNYTGYYVKVDKSHLELGLDIIDDMIFASKMDAEELNRERGAIIEEIHMYEDNPMMHVSDLLERVMFDGSTLGWEIAGTPKIIREVDRDEMYAFWKKYYQPSNMVLVVSGNIDKRVQRWIEETFGTRKSMHKSFDGFADFVLHTPHKKPLARVQTKPTEQIQLAIGFPSFGMQDPRNIALTLLGVILGGNMSSRLFVEVRERKGLAYFVRVANDAYEEVGNFMIRAGLDKQRLDVAVTTIMREVRKIVREPVTAKELRDAKAYIRGQMAIRLEDSYERAQWFAREKMFQKSVRTPEHYLKMIEKITLKDVRAVAGSVLDLKQMSLAAVGPFKNGDDLLKKAKLKT